MATLALGIAGAAAGFVIGGPIGAQLGFLAGSALGSALFPQKGPPPPVQDLKFSGATYGLPRPNAYGKMRVAGTYFWAPDLVQHDSEGGKGGPSVTVTTYTMSAAIGFGEGSSGDLLQLWFDTKLVYDATTADQPVADQALLSALRIYNGAETQQPDPMMQAIKGADVTPAYRGERYITLEDLDITPYGGRRPNVSAVWAPTVEAFPWRVVAHHAGGVDDIAINPVVPYLYAGWGGLYEADEVTFIKDTAIAVTREANPAVIEMTNVPQNAGSFMSPAVDGSGFWFSYNGGGAFGAIKGSFYDPVGALVTSVNNAVGLLGGKDCSGNSVPYDGPTNGSIWENCIETPNGILVALRVGGTLEAWVTNAAYRAAWVSDPGLNSIGQNSALTFNPTPALTLGHLDGWSDPCTSAARAIHPYTIYLVMQHDPTGPETTRPMILAIGDDGAQHTAVAGKEIFDTDGNNTIEVSSAFWDLALNRLYVTGKDLLELDPETLAIKSYDLVKSDGSHVTAYSNILYDVGFATDHTSNYQSQRFTNGRFWTAKAIWVDLDALRPRLNADDQVVYGDAIIEDHSDAPWFTGCLHAAMAYDPLMDCFYSKLAGQRKIYQLFLHRRMESGSVLTLGELVTMISERVGLTAADLDVTQLTQTVNGFLLPQATTGRAAIEQLMAAYGFDMVESGGKIKAVKRGGASALTIAQAELAAHMADANVPPPYELSRALEEDLPREVNVQYYNLAAAYQQGSQRWRRIATPSINVASVNVGCAFTDDEAKQIAERLGWLDWLARTSFKFQLSRKYAFLEPTDVITIGTSEFTVRLTKTQFDQAIVDSEATLEDAATYPSFGAGSAAPAPPPGGGPQITSPAQLVVMDLPSLRESDNGAGIYLAASGFLTGGQSASGWSSSGVYIGPTIDVSAMDIDKAKYIERLTGQRGMLAIVTGDQALINQLINAASYGTSYLGDPGTQPGVPAANFNLSLYSPPADVAAAVAAFLSKPSSNSWTGVMVFRDGVQIMVMMNEAVIGAATTVLGGWSGVDMFDETNSVDISLTHSGMQLFNATEALVLNGSNWAYLSNGASTGEVFGFKNALLLGAGQYRLTGLLRGRQGTEWAANASAFPHAIGNRFVLLDQNTIRWVPGLYSDAGIPHVYKAVAIGGTTALQQTVSTFAAPLRPYCPVLAQAVKQPNDDFVITWVPRAIHNHEWLPGIDVPPDPAFSYYRIQIWAADLSAIKRTITNSGDPLSMSVTYTSALQTTDFGSPQATINFDVAQVNSDYGFTARAIALYPNTAQATYI